MHRRHEKTNIPIELLRALVTIVDTGSFTKAANALNLTQSAISAQIARLNQVVGGSMFAKGAGASATKHGRLVLRYARRMVAINDELLASTSSRPPHRQIVIGLPAWFGARCLTSVFERCSRSATGSQVAFRCDSSEQLLRDLDSGALDLAFLCNAEVSLPNALARWSERTFWVKSPRLTLSPGTSIPLIAWPGSFPHRIAVEALQNDRLQFHISFSAPDLSVRLTAATNGLGVLAVQDRLVSPGLEEVREGLPLLPDNKTGLFSREGLDLGRIDPLLKELKQVLAPLHSGRPNLQRPTRLATLRDVESIAPGSG
jgi:DNA-binding transcriptional LysR family regulator